MDIDGDNANTVERGMWNGSVSAIHGYEYMSKV